MLTLSERERVFKVMTNLGLALWDDTCEDHDMLWQVRRANIYNLLINPCQPSNSGVMHLHYWQDPKQLELSLIHVSFLRL